MVSVRRVAPILLLAVTIPAWADEPQAAKTDTQPAVTTTTAKTQSTTKTTKAGASAPTSTAPTSTAPASTSTAPASTSTSPASTSTAPASTSTSPATTSAAKKSKKAKSTKAAASKSEKKPVAKTAAKAAPKPTHPPRELHKIGDHWTPYKPPDPSTYPAGAKTYTIKQGDTLWALAKQFYNNAYLWPQLWEANTWITDSHWIYPGDVLLVQGEVVQQAQEGAAATTPGAPTAPAAGAQAPTGFGTPAAPRPVITAADAVGGTTSPVPLGTDADVYCFGYIGSPNEMLPNRVAEWEDTELRYQPGATRNEIDGSEGDLVFIDGGSATGLNAGDTYMLVVPADIVRNPKTHEVVGRAYEYRGQVKVLCTDATKSRGLITQSCSEVPVGAKLKPLPQIPIPLARIPSLPAFCDPSSGKKTGLIVNANGGVWLDELGEGQLVQVDLGNDDQVGPGEFLTVFRDGIPGHTPRQVLGELAVLTAENHTATARIVLMRYPMRVGDSVEIR